MFLKLSEMIKLYAYTTTKMLLTCSYLIPQNMEHVCSCSASCPEHTACSCTCPAPSRGSGSWPSCSSRSGSRRTSCSASSCPGGPSSQDTDNLCYTSRYHNSCIWSHTFQIHAQFAYKQYFKKNNLGSRKIQKENLLVLT